MPVQTSLWLVGEKPRELSVSALATEKLLETMIVAAPKLLSDEWMLIGRQEQTSAGGIVDLIAIAPDGALILIELKRDRTPRDVVAQSLDYASWIQKLKPEDISRIYSRFSPGQSLSIDFQSRFGYPLDEDNINSSHQIIIVASSLDPSTERIVDYLNDRDIPINVLFFQIFENDSDQFITRTWLIDPVETQVNSSTAASDEPWNGEFYHSFGNGTERSWEDAVEFGFICAGGAPWYSRTLQLLDPGDRVWVKVPGRGFVGVAKVIGRSGPAQSFRVGTSNGDKHVLEVAKRANYHRELMGDLEKCEYFVAVEWIQTVSLENAVQEIGMFGNQNSICRPTSARWRSTVARLKEIFRNAL
jgi:hypothetical protein